MNLPLDIYPLIFLHCDNSLWKSFLTLCKNVTSRILGSEHLWKEMCLKYFDEPDEFTLTYFAKSWKYGIWENTMFQSEELPFSLCKYVRTVVEAGGNSLLISSIVKISDDAKKFDLNEDVMNLRLSKNSQFFYLCKIANEIFSPTSIYKFARGGMTLMKCNPTRKLYRKKIFMTGNKKTVKKEIYSSLIYETNDDFRIFWDSKEKKIAKVELIGNYGREMCTLVSTNQDPIEIF